MNDTEINQEATIAILIRAEECGSGDRENSDCQKNQQDLLMDWMSDMRKKGIQNDAQKFGLSNRLKLTLFTKKGKAHF